MAPKCQLSHHSMFERQSTQQYHNHLFPEQDCRGMLLYSIHKNHAINKYKNIFTRILVNTYLHWQANYSVKQSVIWRLHQYYRAFTHVFWYIDMAASFFPSLIGIESTVGFNCALTLIVEKNNKEMVRNARLIFWSMCAKVK